MRISDWSSDVCSSDLGTTQTVNVPINPALFLPGDNSLNLRFIGHYTRDCEDPFHSSLWANVSNTRSVLNITTQSLPLKPDLARQIGRASCRERVCQSV